MVSHSGITKLQNVGVEASFWVQVRSDPGCNNCCIAPYQVQPMPGSLSDPRAGSRLVPMTQYKLGAKLEVQQTGGVSGKVPAWPG